MKANLWKILKNVFCFKKESEFVIHTHDHMSQIYLYERPMKDTPSTSSLHHYKMTKTIPTKAQHFSCHTGVILSHSTLPEGSATCFCSHWPRSAGVTVTQRNGPFPFFKHWRSRFAFQIFNGCDYSIPINPMMLPLCFVRTRSPMGHFMLWLSCLSSSFQLDTYLSVKFL